MINDQSCEISFKINYFCRTKEEKEEILEKIRNIFKGEHGTFFKFTIFNVVLFLILWLTGPGNTLIHWGKAKSELKRQNQQMELYSREIEHMRRQVEMLNSDRDTLEKFAREQFFFSVPGEDVYIVDE